MDKISELLALQGLSKSRLEEVKRQAEGYSPTSKVEKVGLRGHLKILGISDKDVWTHCDEHNLITNTGFSILASMWGRPTPPLTYDKLKPNRIAIGTGFDAAPTVSKTTLQMGASPTYIADLTAVTALGSPSVNGCRFEMLVPNGTNVSPYNNITYKEAGLFSEDYGSSHSGGANMIAYKTYPDITKTDQFSLLYLWSFTFVVAP